MKSLFLALAVLIVGLALSAPAPADPTTPELYATLLRIGKQAQVAGKYDLASEAFYRATKLGGRTALAQLLLVQNFVNAGQTRRAEAYLRHVLKDPQQRANATYYQDALAALLDENPFQLSGSFVLTPTSNVNNVASEQFFDTLLGRFEIADGGQERFGIGADIGGQLRYRKPLGGGMGAALSVSVNRGLSSEKSLRYWRGRIGANLSYAGPVRDWQIGVFADRKTYDDGAQNGSERLSFGVNGSFVQLLNERQKVSLSALIEHRTYLNAAPFTGPYFSLNATLTTQHARGATSFLRAHLERWNTELDYHRYWGMGAEAGYEANATETLRLGVNAGATFRAYDGVFPAVGFGREDKVFSIGVSAMDSRIELFGTTPQLTCRYERQLSNIALYSKNTTECQIGWSYRF